MIIYGVSANEHDASLAVIDNTDIVFAAHAERYSRVKNDRDLNAKIVEAASQFGPPDRIIWYEKPLLKRTRKLWAGQWDQVLKKDGVSYLRDHMGDLFPHRTYDIEIEPHVFYSGHHRSHAAAGYFTSPFDDAAILVVDAIGEWDTITAWVGEGRSLKRIYRQCYPHSLGLLYSAFTHYCGLKPNEEEYILMGMAGYGQPSFVDDIRREFIADVSAPQFRLKENVHRGVRWWREDDPPNHFDVAASIQKITEDYLVSAVRWLRETTGKKNLVLMGGVALNCVANSVVARDGAFERIWIMPNPGDAGSSIGAAASHLNQHLNWKHPYLGTEIVRTFDQESAVKALVDGEVIGVANGRAEFGPRALGNRSLITDPRGAEVKDRVNKIKKRELFRPFAPIVMAQHAHRYFDMPVAESPYMQFVAKVRDPQSFPGITHIDGTARVQTVTKDQNPTIYGLLERFHALTGCPLLLNTSLNIKGEPLVDTWDDAMRFQAKHGVTIF